MTTTRARRPGIETVRLPSSLSLRLHRRDEHVELRIDGARVIEAGAGRTRRRPFDGAFQGAYVAEIVFEHRLARLRAEGFVREAGPRPREAPEAASDASHAARVLAAALERRGDPRGTLMAAQIERLCDDNAETRELEGLVLASTPRTSLSPLPDFDEPLACLDDEQGGLVGWCCDEDDVTLEDVVRPELSRIGREALGFSPEDRSVSLGVVGLHRLRRLLESAAGDSLRSLRLLSFGKLEPYLRLLQEHGRAGVVSSLLPYGPAPALGDSLPGLQGLGVSERALPALLSAKIPSLRRLVVFRSDDDVRPVLGQLDPARLPSLEHLGLWYRRTTRDGLRAIAAHPITARLKTLEIWSTEEARRLPFHDLVALRPSLSHLERVLLGGHLVPDDVRERLSSWPAIELVDHDRIQALGLDIVALGWASGMR